MRKFILCSETPYIIVIEVGKQWNGDTFRSNGLVRERERLSFDNIVG